MTRHSTNSPIVVVTITITLFIGLCIGQIFTDSVAFDSSITWAVDGIYGSVGGLTTREASGLPPNDDLYIACTSGLMKLNKSSTLSTNTSLVYPVVTSTITDLVAPHLVNRSGRIEFWVPTRQSPARFGRFNTTTLALLVDGSPNPVDIDVVDNIFASFPYNGYSYFIAETGLVQVYQQIPGTFTPFTPSPVLPFFSSSSVTADQWLEGTVVFIGSQNGTVYKIVVDEVNFQSSTIQRFNIPTTQMLKASAADPIRGYVYFAEPGSSNTLVRIYKLPMASFNSVLGHLELPAIDFDVASAIIDPYGLLYLGLTVFPPKVAQISLPNFEYETTLVFPSTVGSALSPLLDPSSGRLFWSSYDITSFDPQLVATDPASGCPNMCSGNGDCLYRYCYCDSFVSPNNFTFNYTQPACFGKPCDYDCHGNGTCDLALGICVCNENFTGSYCDIPQCPNNCTASSGQGSCVYSPDGTPMICSCSEGWTGHDCSESTYLPCYRYDTCDKCGSKNPNCGWCSDSATCEDGNELGPFFETGCHNWHYRECPKGLDIINWIILIIIIILFVINMISFTVDDTSGVEIPPRLDWYRFQRSCKAWTLLFQFQFIAACGLFDINFPTIFTSFTNFWYPLAFGYGLPTDNDSLESTSRRPLNVIQYVTYIEQTENQILSGVLLWSVIVFVAALILYFLSIVFALIRGKTGLGDNVKDKVFYVSCRIIEAFYFGLVVFSATQLSQYKYVSDGMLGLAAIILIVIGLGWPIAHLVLVMKYQKNLFKKAQRVRFFPMYGTLQVLKLKFVVVPILKKLLLGVFIGFLSENRVPQLLLVWLVHILYFIFVLAGDPFIDILQKYLELFISGINILSMPVLMGFLKDEISFDAQVGVTVLFTVLQILCVVGSMAFYFISWSQMHEVFTFNQLKALLCCRKVDPSVTELQRLR